MVRMPADQNFSHHGEVFPQPFLNQHLVSFQSEAGNDIIGSSSAEVNNLGCISSMTGIVMTGNTSEFNHLSLTNPPCNSSGNTLRDPTNSSNHCMGLSTYWSDEELDVLRHGLARYVNESSTLKYIKIANFLPDKTVRDVAMRCRWMTKKEQGKRRKAKQCYALKKVKDEKEMVTSSSSIHCIQPENTATYSHSVVDVHQSYQVLHKDPAIDNAVQHLLVENFQLLSQIERNLAVNEIEGNIHLFCRTRENIAAILNNTSQMPGTVSEMPSLPVSVDQCLLHCMFSSTTQIHTLSSILPKEEPRSW